MEELPRETDREDSRTRSPGQRRDLVALAAELPACITLQASGGQPANQHFFWYPSNIQLFGERLVYIAGLAVAALYVHYRKTKPTQFPPDPTLEKDYLKTLLFGRGYHRGIACAIIQRAGDIRTGPFKIVVGDDRLVTRFAAASADRPGDRLRAVLWEPIEDSFAQLLHHLSFLKKLDFKEPGDVRFQKMRINPLPFLSWDGKTLRLFRHFFPEDQQLAFLDFQSPDTTIRERASGLLLTRLSELAKLLSLPEQAMDARPPISDEGPTSIVPYIADTYPLLPKLARMLWMSADDETKIQLWLRKKFRDNENAARALLDSTDRGESVGITEIVKHCLEHDPIAAIEEFFAIEVGDVREYIDKLVDDRREASRIYAALQEAVSKHRRSLRAFFPSEIDTAAIEEEVKQYRARVAAVRVSRLIGFPIVEFNLEMDLQGYIDRARSLCEYLKSDEAIDEGKVEQGLVACSKAAERILRFLCLFYRAVPYFSAKTVEGISREDRAAVAAIRADMQERRPGLGKLIGEFSEMNDDQEIRRALWGALQREHVWPKDTANAPLAGLNLLRDLRNLRVHSDEGDLMRSAVQAVTGFQMFLDWLDDPHRSPNAAGTGSVGRSPWRIYPWVVTLNLVTTTRSGVTSLKYMLQERHGAGRHRRQETTVYTSQPLSVTNCYYGLPNPGKFDKNLWVEPLLLQADIFSSEDSEHG